MSQPLVSVVLPVRTGGIYLVDAVNSILSQSLENIELILVDDHSLDRAVIDLDHSDPRIQIHQNPGKGVIDASNHGFSMARGRYLARMDADDISLPGRLMTQVEYLEQHPDIDIAGARVALISENEIQGGFLHYQQWLNSVCTPEEISKQLFIESPIPNPTAMFRKEALTRLQGYKDLGWPEDYDLFLRADQAGMSMGKPEPILFQWREHPARLTHTDKRYSRRKFQQAKAHYLANGRLPGGDLVLWGAGPGGRLFFDLLRDEGREVSGFIDIHPRRIGREKRGKPIRDASEPGSWPDGFIMVAVGSRGARDEIRSAISDTGRREGEDFVFVA